MSEFIAILDAESSKFNVSGLKPFRQWMRLYSASTVISTPFGQTQGKLREKSFFTPVPLPERFLTFVRNDR